MGCKLFLRRTLRDLPPDIVLEETVHVVRVRKVEHDITVKPPVGVLHFTAMEGGFRAVYFTDIERIIGRLGGSIPRPTAGELEREERENKRRARLEKRRNRRARRSSTD